jgi:hypothetical protein
MPLNKMVRVAVRRQSSVKAMALEPFAWCLEIKEGHEALAVDTSKLESFLTVVVVRTLANSSCPGLGLALTCNPGLEGPMISPSG